MLAGPLTARPSSPICAHSVTQLHLLGLAALETVNGSFLLKLPLRHRPLLVLPQASGCVLSLGVPFPESSFFAVSLVMLCGWQRRVSR